MNSYFPDVPDLKVSPQTKTDIKAALIWGAVLLVILSLIRGAPLTDLYDLALTIRTFLGTCILFLDATLDVLAYVLLLGLFSSLAFAVIGVSRALVSRRK